MLPRIASLLALGAFAFATPLSAQCTDWSSAFTGTGATGYVYAVQSFDDGGGSAVYIAGQVKLAGGEVISGVAKYDGTTWTSVGPPSSPTIFDLEVFDDGSGPKLYALGNLRVSRLDGTSWTLIGGLDASGTAMCATVFDDGGGPALYVGGRFATIGSTAASNVAKWNGSAWSALPDDLDDYVFALAGYDDGAGPALYAGGSFTGGGGPSYFAKLDGGVWTALANAPTYEVNALATFDDGGGERLYVGGAFHTTGATVSHGLASWNGSTWSDVGGSLTTGKVSALRVVDTGVGPRLFVAGSFGSVGTSVVANDLAAWDGANWTGTDAGTGGEIFALDARPGVGGDDVVVGGNFYTAGAFAVRNVAQWDAPGWSLLGIGPGVDEQVHALAEFDDGNGPALYAGGAFTSAQGVALARIGRFDGAQWSPLAEGLSAGALTPSVAALHVHDDGTGSALFVGGSFTTAGTSTAFSVARWNGTVWSPMQVGVSGTVAAFETFPAVGGSLYVGGNYSAAGSVVTENLARWDGTNWHAVGGGVPVDVRALAVFDDGTGPALFVGGSFTLSGGGPGNRVAKWNGTTWGAVPGIASGYVGSLAVFDDGGGPELYLAGNSVGVRKLSGGSWVSIGTVIGDEVLALRTIDDGSGPRLFAVGSFTSIGGVAASNVARWDGTSWSEPDGGISDPGYSLARAVARFDDGSGFGPGVAVGGLFTSAGGETSHNLALWRNCELGTPFCFGDGGGAACPCFNFAGTGEGCANSSGVGATLSATGSSSVALDDQVFSAAQLPANKSALLFVGPSLFAGGIGTPFGDGLLCVGGQTKRLGVKTSSAGGTASWGTGLHAQYGAWSAGQTRRFQVWYRDPTGPCGGTVNFSHALQIVFAP